VLELAVDSTNGHKEFFASHAQSTLSSLQPLNYLASTRESHRGLRATPSAWELGQRDQYVIRVETATLDEIVSNRIVNPAIRRLASTRINLIKIDVQGWEDLVLIGAKDTLTRTSVVSLELNLDDGYPRRPDLSELNRCLTDAGLRLWDLSWIYKDPVSLRTLWVELIYSRIP